MNNITPFTKYSQTLSVVSNNTITDDVSPFSFEQWYNRNSSILPGKANEQYNKYVTQWYVDQKEVTTTIDTVKEDYKDLLRQLTIAFKSEADASWINDIDFDNPNDLEQALPFYITKLKEIAIYFINKRESIKKAKLKYNMAGTYSTVDRIFREYLLKAFTKNRSVSNEYTTNITNLSVFNSIPELSAVKDDFQIVVEELYDDASYFDRDPSLPASAYFSFNETATAFLDSLNITSSEYEWLYNTGVSTLCADNPLLFSVDSIINQYKNGIPLSALELTDSDVLNEYNKFNLTRKYLGETQYILSGGYYVANTSDTTFNILAENNWFYWLSSNNALDGANSNYVDPIYINDTNLIKSGATAGDDLYTSDIVFAVRNDSVSGAWLKNGITYTKNETMSAKLIHGKTSFNFPFPGYGLSGEGLDWTGRTLDNLDQTYFYLDKEYQKAISDAYWAADDTNVRKADPVYINDTSLSENGALAANKFNEADYIVKQTLDADNNSSFIFSGEREYAWIYKMTQTDLPIKAGSNNLYWPFERYNTSISMYASPSQCSPISLSSININSFAGAIANNNYTGADQIYKKKSPNSLDYTEGAWLRGDLVNSYTNLEMASGYYQPGIYLEIRGGEYGTFVWTDGISLADNVFKHHNHQLDCLYLQDKQFSLYKENQTQAKPEINYNQWADCTCRAVMFSPIGHPGNTFDDYNGMSDFIVAMESPSASFNFKDWIGLDDKKYETSEDFGWFKLDGVDKVEPDVGWGSGNWVNNSGKAFYLKQNVVYCYYRSSLQRDNADANVPYYVTTYKNNNNRVRWCKLTYNKNEDTWVQSDDISDMIIKPGDILEYNHQETLTYTFTAANYTVTEIEVPNAPTVSVSDLTLSLPSCSIVVPIQTVDLSVYACGNWVPTTLADVPLTTLGTISADYFGLPESTSNLTSAIENIAGTTSTIISSITTTEIKEYTYTNETANYILNVPLNGWDYNTSTYSYYATGAKPYWVVASDKDDNYTKNKGIEVWSGYPVLVDSYNFISQPTYSNMKFEDNYFFEYNRRGTEYIIWSQPILNEYKSDEKKWYKLITDKDATFNLKDIFSNINDAIVSATNIESDLLLDIQEAPLLINYYARSAFTWVQNLTNSSIGIPPTGGKWIPVSTDILVNPTAPYTALTNRHYPTYATAPSIGDLYSIKESGGYFIPNMLGVSTAIAKNTKVSLSTSNIDNNPNNRGLDAVYKNLNIYSSDRGVSLKDQIAPTTINSTDISWMKSSITEGIKANRINPNKNQTFTPYQTYFEINKSNNNGIYRQGVESIDPWYGDLDATWEDNVEWPSNFRKQYTIDAWYEQLNKGEYVVYQWKTDVFNNQYALVKPTESMRSSGIYNKKHSIGGILWVRDQQNKIRRDSDFLAAVYENIPEEYQVCVEDNNILDIDIWYDTIMIYTKYAIIMCKIDFDYETNTAYNVANDINIIPLDAFNKFSGIWLHENEKNVMISILYSDYEIYVPMLYNLNLETNELVCVYGDTDEEKYNTNTTYLTSFDFYEYDSPVFTYDRNHKIYNLSYNGYSIFDGNKTYIYLNSVNLKQQEDSYIIVSAKTITPIGLTN